MIIINTNLFSAVVESALQKVQGNSRRINAITKAQGFVNTGTLNLRRVGQMVLISSPQSGELYATQPHDCQCEAFTLGGGQPCWHRELVNLINAHDSIQQMLT